VPSPSEREELYALLRTGAREHRAALMIFSEDSNATRGTDLLMEIGDGELLLAGGKPATVLPFPSRRDPQPGGLEHAGS
jgi:hypothetical protein